MGRIVGVLLLLLPAYAGEAEVGLPVDETISQALELARKHAGLEGGRIVVVRSLTQNNEDLFDAPIIR